MSEEKKQSSAAAPDSTSTSASQQAAESSDMDFQKFLILRKYVQRMKKGSTLLKQESNGLHLRWFVLDDAQAFFYWVNPKRDSLTILPENTIYISDIQSIQLGPAAQVLFEMDDPKALSNVDALSLSFSVTTGTQTVDIYPVSKLDFETWYFGLVFLAGVEKVKTTPLPPGTVLRSHNDLEFLQNRLEEQLELNDSLLKENARLMQIRQDRDRIINMLLDQARLCTCGAQQSVPGASGLAPAASSSQPRSSSAGRAVPPRSPAARSASSVSQRAARRDDAEEEGDDDDVTPPQSPRTPRLDTPTSAATSATAASIARRRLAAYYEEAGAASPASTTTTAGRRAAALGGSVRSRSASSRRLPATPSSARRRLQMSADALFPSAEPYCCCGCGIRGTSAGRVCSRRGGAPCVCRRPTGLKPRGGLRVHYRDEEYADYYDPDESNYGAGDEDACACCCDEERCSAARAPSRCSEAADDAVASARADDEDGEEDDAYLAYLEQRARGWRAAPASRAAHGGLSRRHLAPVARPPRPASRMGWREQEEDPEAEAAEEEARAAAEEEELAAEEDAMLRRAAWAAQQRERARVLARQERELAEVREAAVRDGWARRAPRRFYRRA